MSIHWYAHHLGDYTKATQHLSMSEHGAYRLLLDHCYSVGGRIADDRKAAYRVCKASTPKERRIVDKILSEMFLHEEGFWINKRALKEIAKHCDISEKRRKAAAIAHANAHAKDPPSYNLQPHPTEESNNTHPPQITPVDLPDDWNPTVDHENRCLALGYRQGELAAAFKSNHKAKGHKFVDWDAAFDLWITNQKQFTRKPQGAQHVARKQNPASGTEAVERLIEKWDTNARVVDA